MELQKRMAHVLDVFRCVAASLYRQFGGTSDVPLPDFLCSSDSLIKEKSRPAYSEADLPALLEGLSAELRGFFAYLRDIEASSDQNLRDCILFFVGWIDYRAKRLRDFGGRPQSSALQRYAIGIMPDMGKYLQVIGIALGQIGEDGKQVTDKAEA
ncbi:hypothetical protein FRC04_009614 [Tulasnella sp. 424]|nr:hypothetical protein FRC04_009614 [Tulasnella sp. 424]